MFMEVFQSKPLKICFLLKFSRGCQVSACCHHTFSGHVLLLIYWHCHVHVTLPVFCHQTYLELVLVFAILVFMSCSSLTLSSNIPRTCLVSYLLALLCACHALSDLVIKFFWNTSFFCHPCVFMSCSSLTLSSNIPRTRLV